jgi:hypothetical protein
LQVEPTPPALQSQDDPSLVNLVDFSVGYQSPRASSLFQREPKPSHAPSGLPPATRPSSSLLERCQLVSHRHRSLARSAAASNTQPMVHLLHVMHYLNTKCSGNAERLSSLQITYHYHTNTNTASVNAVFTFPTGRHTTVTASISSA